MKLLVHDLTQEMFQKILPIKPHVSRCYYGGYSPFVKNVLDRSISYVHPYFVIRNGEMHHKRRYDNRILLNVYLYGDNISQAEKDVANRLVKANSINLDCRMGGVVNMPDFEVATEYVALNAGFSKITSITGMVIQGENGFYQFNHKKGSGADNWALVIDQILVGFIK